VAVQTKGQDLYELVLKVDRGAIPVFPDLCPGQRTVTKQLGTSFTIDDGVNPPIEVEALRAWRCRDLVGNDPARSRSLRTP
jgi:hypothetical protein